MKSIYAYENLPVGISLELDLYELLYNIVNALKYGSMASNRITINLIQAQFFINTEGEYFHYLG